MKSKLNKRTAKWKSIVLILASALIITSFASCISTNTKDTEKESETKENIPANSASMDIVDTSKASYSYEEMKEDLQLLQERYKDYLSYEKIGSSLDGKDLYAVTLGNPKAEREILITAGLHAREFFSTMLTMKQMEYYLYNMDAIDISGTKYKDILNEYCFRVLPMCNPDGIMLAQFGISSIKSIDLKDKIYRIYESDKALGYTSLPFEEYIVFWKANAKGVDLNRNFDTEQWKRINYTPYPCFSNYKGEKPLSEPESLAMVKYTESLKNPVLSVAVHSQGEVIYFDCGQENIHPSLKLAKEISKHNGYTVIYDKHGEAAFDDWCIIEKNIPSVTLEIGNFSVSKLPCVKDFEKIFDDNKDLWMHLAIYDMGQKK